MKKSLLYALALATTMVACTDDYTDWAAPQHNDPEDAKSVALSVAATPAIDFANVTTDSVAVFTPSLTAEEGATVSYKITFDEKETLPANNQGQVAAEELNTIVAKLYGKRPTERTLKGVVDAYVNVNGQVMKTTATGLDVKVTLTAPVIESAYYFYGTNNKWSLEDTSLKFGHSDQDVYDDPNFTLTLKAPYKEDGTRDDMWFKIAPQSSIDSASEVSILGCTENGDQSLTGALVGKEPQAICMPASDGAKAYKIILNMMDYTYTIKPLVFEEYIYMPGDHQAWTPATAPSLRSADSDGIYVGYTYLNTEFKFTLERNWDDGEYNNSAFDKYSDIFSGEGTGNIKVSTPGYYYLKADMTEGSLTAETIQWGIIGDATPDKWDASTPMTLDPATATWSVTTTLTDGELKFRANDDWAYNMGGSLDALSQDGSNIRVTAGTYKITLDLNDASNYHCTMVKQ